MKKFSFLVVMLATCITLQAQEEISVSRAFQITQALAEGTSTTEEYIVKGIVSEINTTDEGLATYKNCDFWMRDLNDVSFKMKAFRTKGFAGSDFTVGLIAVGDTVKVQGVLMNYVNPKTSETLEEIYKGNLVEFVVVVINGIYYDINYANLTATVTYRGRYYDEYDEYTGNVVIPATVTYDGKTYSVTSIGDYAFRGCSGLTSVTIPNSVTSIGELAFYGCSGLTSVTIPNSVTSIRMSAFCGCSGLTSLTIPNSVTSIEYNAFSGCSGLTSVTIPNSVTSIGYYAFEYCSGLTSVTIPNSVTSIEDNAFYGCSGLTSVTIPNSVTSIGDQAFRGCSGLTSVTIPNSVTSIEWFAFSNCSGLTSVVWNAKNCADFSRSNYAPFYDIASQITSFTFGSEVEHIPAYLCYGMENLTSVTIPNSVTSIGKSAFDECTQLTNIVCYAAEPPSCGTSVFANYDASLKVPCSSLEAYKAAAVWGSFNNISCIGSEEVQVTEFSVTPSTNEALFTWPTEPNAATYELVISKDGVVFCTLTFNASGQLMGIAFAPGAGTAATTATSGFQFTVTGLNEASHYTYTFDAKDAGGSVVKHYAGEFNTGGITVGLEQIELAGLYTQAGRIVCEGEFRIYDLLGRDVTRLNGSLCGVYVVKSGNVAVKVVVK